MTKVKKAFTLTALIMLILLSSCGMPFQSDLVVKGATRQFSSSNPAFHSYIETFETQARAITGQSKFVVGDVPINFGDTENEDFKGVCFKYTDGTYEVIIKKSWWDNASTKYRESLVFHELGHCRLGRDHLDDTTEKDGRNYKVSMMNSIIVSASDYEPYQSEYLVELFTNDYSDLFLSLGVTEVSD